MWKESVLDQQKSIPGFLLISTRNLSGQGRGRGSKSVHCKLKPTVSTIFCTSVDTPLSVTFRDGVKCFFGQNWHLFASSKRYHRHPQSCGTADRRGSPFHIAAPTQIQQHHNCANADTVSCQLLKNETKVPVNFSPNITSRLTQKGWGYQGKKKIICKCRLIHRRLHSDFCAN